MAHVSGVTLDAGPLIALDKNGRKVIVLLALADSSAAPLTVPATALAQAMRNPARQARLSRLIRQPRVNVVHLDRPDAIAVGNLLAASGTADIADAHVVHCAVRARQPIATSDPDDLQRLTDEVELIAV